jgi:hypothetical protein
MAHGRMTRTRRPVPRVPESAALALMAFFAQPAQALPASAPVTAMACGGFSSGGYGPYDYRTQKDKLPIVEGFHFTPEVEMLIRGKSSSDIGDDIHYTLDVFPNHHRALVSMMRLAERLKTPQPPGAKYTMDCYFDRAVRFAPTDEVARLLYANYLVKMHRLDEAGRQLTSVESLAADNAFTHFNLGLVYLEMKSYDKALDEAHRAQQLGLRKTALMDGLKKAGQWRDAPPGPDPLPEHEATSASAAAGGP